MEITNVHTHAHKIIQDDCFLVVKFDKITLICTDQ